MAIINPHQEAKFRASQRDAHSSYMKHTILWRRSKNTHRDEFGEDNIGEQYEDIALLCLPNFNYMRTWPVDQSNETGRIEKQSVQIFFSRIFLKEQGYLNSDNNFAYDPGKDKFVLNGMQYEPEGDTDASSLQADPLLFTLIILRQPKATGKNYR